MKFIKKLLIIFACLFALIFISATIYNHFYPMKIYYWLNPPKCPTCVTELTYGKSMNANDKDGQPVVYDTALIPKKGDIVAFNCYTDKCMNGTGNGKMKRLIKINENGCYWFEGDNKNNSWDSRNYGWLCPPDDIKILGVVIK